MSEIYDWDIAAANNNDAPPNGAPEFMEYSEVNNTIRECMAVLSRWRDGAFSGFQTAGTQPAYTLVSGQNISAYANGMMFAFRAHATSTGAVTLNVDGVGAVAVLDSRGNQLVSGDVVLNGVYFVVKTAASWRVIGAMSAVSIAALALASVSFRTALTANRTYYVRADGSDSNTGLVDNAGGAFLTVQKAIDVVYNTLDLAGFNVDIQIRDGLTYGGAIVARPQVGAGDVTLKGNASAPANVRLSTTGLGELGGTLNVRNGAVLLIQDFEIVSTTSGHGIITRNNGLVVISGGIRFAACAEAHILATQGGRVNMNGNYSIVGGAQLHWWANSLGEIRCQGRTITLTGTPAFSTAFAQADYSGVLTVNGNAYSGSATGKRFSALNNGVIAALAGLTELPGNATGTAGTGGQYPGLNLTQGASLVSGLTIVNNGGSPTTQLDISTSGRSQIGHISEVGALTIGGVSITLNAATTGVNGLDTGSLAANTWYYIFLISDGATVASLLSLSSTAPTMPTGYIYRSRIGAQRTGGAATFNRVIQKGNRARYVVVTGSVTPNLPQMASGLAGSITTPTWVAVPTGNFVPPTAQEIYGALYQQNGVADVACMVAPNNNYGAKSSNTNPPPVSIGGPQTGNAVGAIPFNFPLESTDIYWANNNANSRVLCMGWVDSVNAL